MSYLTEKLEEIEKDYVHVDIQGTGHICPHGCEVFTVTETDDTPGCNVVEKWDQICCDACYDAAKDVHGDHWIDVDGVTCIVCRESKTY